MDPLPGGRQAFRRHLQGRNLKLEPQEGRFFREQYEDIIPGYYMNKEHWNSIRLEGSVPAELIRELAEKSYRLVLHGLSKKKQKEILGEG